MDRRQLLLSGAAALIGCKAPPSPSDTDGEPPTPADPREPSPPPHEPAGEPDLTVFPLGVLVGDPTVDAAEVRVRSTLADFELVVFGWNEGWTEVQRVPVTTGSVTASARITGLEAGQPYCVHAEAGSARSAVTRFRTAPAAGTSYALRIGASSCFGFTNAALANLEHTVGADLDVFLQLGDYVYADGSTTVEDYAAVWERYLRRPGARALTTSTALVHTWDDHEVSNNWTLEPDRGDSITPALLADATDVWRQMIPMGPGLGGSGVWRSVRWGDVAEFFVLDCRGERHGNGLVSPEQLAWFERAMAASTAVFKVVLSSVHLTDHTELFSVVQEADRWQGHPSQRASLVATCVNTPGTLVITGDMHFGAVQRVDAEGPGNGLWEIAAGPSGSRLIPLAGILEITGMPAQYELLVEAWSWCDLRLDPNTLRVSVDFIGDDGAVIDRRELQL